MTKKEEDPKQYALDNIYMLAKREARKTKKDVKDAESWMHVLRLCEEAGCKSSILR